MNEVRTPARVTTDSVLFEALLVSLATTLGEKKGHRLLKEMARTLAQTKDMQNVSTIQTPPAESAARVSAVGGAVATFHGMLPRVLSSFLRA